jgi:LPXTG-motif cell wall-anchored protein
MFQRLMLVIGLTLLALGLTAPVSAQSATARVRVIHASPDAPAVDVFVDGSAALTNVAFKAISDYLDVPAGAHTIQVAPTGAGAAAAVITANPTLEAGKAYTVAAVGLVANIKAQIYNDNLAAPAAGKAHVRVIHASPDAPAVAVKVAGGPTLIPSLAFPSASDYLPVDAGSYNLQVTPAGANDVVLDLPNTQLAAGTIYDVVAVGQLANIGVAVATFTPQAAAAPGTLPNTGASENLALGLSVVGLLALASGMLVRRRAS